MRSCRRGNFRAVRKAKLRSDSKSEDRSLEFGFACCFVVCRYDLTLSEEASRSSENDVDLAKRSCVPKPIAYASRPSPSIVGGRLLLVDSDLQWFGLHGPEQFSGVAAFGSNSVKLGGFGRRESPLASEHTCGLNRSPESSPGGSGLFHRSLLIRVLDTTGGNWHAICHKAAGPANDAPSGTEYYERKWRSYMVRAMKSRVTGKTRSRMDKGTWEGVVGED